MYKVLVVDDEPLMLEGWKTMVDWHAYGYELSGTATDGEEALAAIRASEPDLVVTDIRMPVLDGIGLIRAMKEELGVSSKTVIVSGYSEFNYAQQALRYQVDRYVLKPLLTEEIHKLLLELSGPLEERRLAMASVGKEQDAAAAAAIISLLRNADFAMLETAERLLGADGQTRCRLVIAESAASSSSSGGAEAGGTAVYARLQAFVEAGFAGRTKTWLFEDTPGRAGLLVLEEGPGREPFEARLAETAAALGWPLRELAMYCSGSACGLAALPKLYRQAMETRSRALLGRMAGVHPYRERSAIADGCRLEDVMSLASSLLQAIEEGDTDGIDGFVDDLLRLLEKTGAEEVWLHTVVLQVCGELLRKYGETDDGAADASVWPRLLLGEDDPVLTASWSGEALRKLCKRAAERLAERKASATCASGTAVAEAIDYLKLHYREKVQLKALAKRFHLSPVYFGQQFKRETGISFNEYLHRLRIEEACKMLRRTNMKLSDIAATLGYHDTQYFSDKFKALTGELPSSYKSKGKG
jgi:two-component system response regulator YesN